MVTASSFHQLETLMVEEDMVVRIIFLTGLSRVTLT
jgi:hypothetical protein